MSTDTYIDVHRKDFLSNKMDIAYPFYNDESYISFRIGHIAQLSNSNYNIYIELSNLNFVYSVLDKQTITEIYNKYIGFLKAKKIINTNNNNKLRDYLGNYGCNEFHKNQPITDVVSSEKLITFLNKNECKHWKLRVD